MSINGQFTSNLPHVTALERVCPLLHLAASRLVPRVTADATKNLSNGWPELKLPCCGPVCPSNISHCRDANASALRFISWMKPFNLVGFQSSNCVARSDHPLIVVPIASANKSSPGPTSSQWPLKSQAELKAPKISDILS